MRGMRNYSLTFLLILLLIPLLPGAELEKVGSVERLDPGLDAIVPKDAVIEKLADGFKWTEGPVWIHAGYLLFAEIPSNRIMKWSPQGGTSVFLQPSGYTGKEPFTGPEAGSNGMTLDPRGQGVTRNDQGEMVSLLPVS